MLHLLMIKDSVSVSKGCIKMGLPHGIVNIINSDILDYKSSKNFNLKLLSIHL